MRRASTFHCSAPFAATMMVARTFGRSVYLTTHPTTLASSR
ncbi:MAG: hypothetical protein AB7U73_12580 [Pirellulales bacterium]